MKYIYKVLPEEFDCNIFFSKGTNDFVREPNHLIYEFRRAIVIDFSFFECSKNWI